LPNGGKGKEEGEMMKDYYPGPNPPQKWKEKHPHNITCDQCKNTFDDRTAFTKHFKKEEFTCIFHTSMHHSKK
jgi:hypothetical protein